MSAEILTHGLSGSSRRISGFFGFDWDCCAHTSHWDTFFRCPLTFLVNTLHIWICFCTSQFLNENCVSGSTFLISLTLGWSTCDFWIKVHQHTRLHLDRSSMSWSHPELQLSSLAIPLIPCLRVTVILHPLLWLSWLLHTLKERLVSKKWNEYLSLQRLEQGTEIWSAESVC